MTDSPTIFDQLGRATDPEPEVFKVDYAVRLGPIVTLEHCPNCDHVNDIVDARAVEPALEEAELLPKTRCKCGKVLQGHKPPAAIITGEDGDRIITLK